MWKKENGTFEKGLLDKEGEDPSKKFRNTKQTYTCLTGSNAVMGLGRKGKEEIKKGESH